MCEDDIKKYKISEFEEKQIFYYLDLCFDTLKGENSEDRGIVFDMLDNTKKYFAENTHDYAITEAGLNELLAKTDEVKNLISKALEYIKIVRFYAIDIDTDRYGWRFNE